MEIGDYLRVLRQRGWIIIVVAVLAAVAAYGFSKMQTPVYESSLRMLVQPARTDFGQSQAAKLLLRGYVQWIRSSYRAASVIDELQLDMEPNELLADTNVASDDSSFVIQIDVENTDPNLANQISQSWGNLFIQWRIDDNATQRKEDRVDVEFIDDPIAGLDRPKTKINALAGLIFGAMVGVIIIFALEWIESGVVRRSEDIERYLDIPVIGKIPSE
ncbi:MAG TPA: Wzz/FepE/Etk N-terminal domain-containing protein [candidate division Zixibacteria bacterium]|nr:Wzz/FepE/Etk N-terminal domain-containing protein [candidate division Zixibacteria bacterium]